MNLTLNRILKKEEGIFSELRDEKGVLIAFTLEHSYSLEPKIYNGTFKCMRGTHQLHDGVPFVTFEIMGVEGHSNLLFHAGNFNHDSEGCILLGQEIVNNMITNSKQTFLKFMELQSELDIFTLTVAG